MKKAGFFVLLKLSQNYKNTQISQKMNAKEHLKVLFPTDFFIFLQKSF